MRLYLVLMMSSQIVSCTSLKKRKEKNKKTMNPCLVVKYLQHSKTAGLCNMWYLASWERWFEVCWKTAALEQSLSLALQKGQCCYLEDKMDFLYFHQCAAIPALAWMQWGSQVSACRAPKSLIWGRKGTMWSRHSHRLMLILLNWDKLDISMVFARHLLWVLMSHLRES